METSYVRHLPKTRSRSSARAQAISLLGPLTIAAGLIWAIVQPYRLTILHPHHQGFWWLAIEPPLLVIVAGVAFALVVARPLIYDLEARNAASR